MQCRCCFWWVLKVLDKHTSKPNCSHSHWRRMLGCHGAHADLCTVLADHAGTHQHTHWYATCYTLRHMQYVPSLPLPPLPAILFSLLLLPLCLWRCLMHPQRPTSVTTVASPTTSGWSPLRSAYTSHKESLQPSLAGRRWHGLYKTKSSLCPWVELLNHNVRQNTRTCCCIWHFYWLDMIHEVHTVMASWRYWWGIYFGSWASFVPNDIQS